jgi:hypothetical protein
MHEQQREHSGAAEPQVRSDKPAQRALTPEDAERVAQFLERGVNSVPRKPFKPLRLLIILTGIVLGLSLFSQLLARWAGVY